jgi:hypothetical protein
VLQRRVLRRANELPPAPHTSGKPASSRKTISQKRSRKNDLAEKRKAFSMRRIFIPSEARDPYRFEVPLEGHFHIAKNERHFL